MNKVKLVKITCLAMSMISTLGLAWVSTKENEAAIAKLIAKQVK